VRHFGNQLPRLNTDKLEILVSYNLFFPVAVYDYRSRIVGPAVVLAAYLMVLLFVKKLLELKRRAKLQLRVKKTHYEFFSL
jgi:hypothetical protein